MFPKETGEQIALVGSFVPGQHGRIGVELAFSILGHTHQGDHVQSGRKAEQKNPKSLVPMCPLGFLATW